MILSMMLTMRTEGEVVHTASAIVCIDTPTVSPWDIPGARDTVVLALRGAADALESGNHGETRTSHGMAATHAPVETEGVDIAEEVAR